MADIKVKVQNKKAENLTADVVLVCGNEGYTVEFDLDQEWDNANFKTGLFISANGDLVAQPFDGNVCEIPVQEKTTLLAIGVKTSDGLLHTTTPAWVKYLNSASDLAKNEIPAPTQDVYDEIIALLNKYIGQGGGGGLTEEQVKEIVQETAVTQESDPTVPTWAKEPTKPTYSYEEITDKPDHSEYVKFTDYATANKAGVVKVVGANTYGIRIGESGQLFVDGADETAIKGKASAFMPIVPNYLDYAVKVGVTTNTETLTDEEQKTACAWLGATKLYAHNITDLNGFKFQVITNVSTQIERSAWGAIIYSGDPNIRIVTINVFGSSLSTGITISPIINAQMLQGLRMLYYDYSVSPPTPAIYSIGGFATYEITEI